MADRMYQNIRIGGDPGENRLNLMFMVEEAGFDEIVEDTDCLYCDAPEATPYDFDELKEYLRTIGLPYDHFFEARYDSEGEIIWWRPGMDDEERCYALQTENPTIPIGKLDEMLKANRYLTVAEVIELVAIPELPAWTLES